MKRTLLILLACSSVLLAGCDNAQEAYNKARASCTMTGYDIVSYNTDATQYECKSKEDIRMDRFRRCSNNCDTAIDDNRDLTLQNSSTETIACLKLCMGE